jgi:hypothetical protein
MINVSRFGIYAVTTITVSLGIITIPCIDHVATPRFLTVAQASEKGDFNRIAPQYHKATNTVTFEGRIYIFDKKGMIDMDSDGVRETTLERYVFDANRKVVRYETKGRTWAWAVYENFRDKEDVLNYGVADWDGKNGFDTKVTTTEDFGLPEYLK